MDSSLIDFLKYVWPIMALPIAWLFKMMNDLRSEQSNMKRDHYETKIHAAETYVSKNDYREDLKTLFLKLDAMADKQDAQYAKILERLDRKADK